MCGNRLWLSAPALIAGAIYAYAQMPALPEDKYRWLEDVWGGQQLAWVNAHNEKSAKILENDPHFAGLAADALKLLESHDRLPVPALKGDLVYNTWQDEQHVRGILRRTSLADYLEPQPHWKTVLDYDALAKSDNQRWVARGLDCLYPGGEFCMVELSAGGEDAVSMREFNLKTGEFVAGGFVLPTSKQNVSWIDKDTLLVGRDWGAGTMTKSGYPFVLKIWRRSEPLEAAKEVFRATPDDVAARPRTLNDANGHSATVIRKDKDFFHTEHYLLTAGRPRPIAMPAKASIEGLIDGQLVIGINEDWKPEVAGAGFASGSVLTVDLAALQKDPAHLKPRVLFAPTPVEFVQTVNMTKDRVLLTTLENVQGRAYVYSPNGNGAWARKRLPIPENAAVTVTTTNRTDNSFFLTVTGFLTPSSLWMGDAATGSLKQAKTLPPQFDASKDMVEQLSATSKDGTKVPYFVVRPKAMKFDGSNPVVMTAYGGFQLSRTPAYSAVVGKLWLERGGVFVLANIRGGGEFGPAWHEAGLKTHRQRIYDDFAAVGQDLIARKITSARRLGIEGGSNGGLLVGVEMMQHPEMWNAVVIQVPLLDMLGYEHIAAGASWVGEYGSVSVPEERAFLASISPYNQLRKDVDYPEPLIFTTTKDDRVGPVHARKFAAKMEEFGKPFFYDEIVEGGHGAGADLKERAKTDAVEYTYLTRKLMN